MKRNIDLNEISDGKRYHSSSMVRLDCDNCSGCCSCCKDMGNSIVLDPYDIFHLTTRLGKSLDDLLKNAVTLSTIDSIILPVLNMEREDKSCYFLNESGLCSIHRFRPGICRLFPLGRVYEEDHFDYILQTKECKKGGRNKIKISQWLGLPDLKPYEKFILDWHNLLRDLENEIAAMTDLEQIRTIQLMLLHLFFRTPYDAGRDFYIQFYERLNKIG